jgi:acetyl esterase/lipase
MKRLVGGAVLLGLVGLVGFGPVRADDAKALFEVETEKGVAYTGKEGNERQQLDLYLPKGAKNYPVFVFIHGGGWTKGSKAGFAKHGNTFASHGVGFVSVGYRLDPVPPFPANIEDVAAAFAWVHANLGKRGANVGQIYVSGHSAGGHLVALLASDGSYLKTHKLSAANIKGVVPISGVFTVSGKLFGDEESSKKASPMTHVKADLPPFLIFYADKEAGGLGKQAEQFGEAMQKVKNTATVRMIKDRDHRTIMQNVAQFDDPVTHEIFAFIARQGGLSKSE